MELLDPPQTIINCSLVMVLISYQALSEIQRAVDLYEPGLERPGIVDLETADFGERGHVLHGDLIER